MRILITADLHYRSRYTAQFDAFAHHVASLQPDCFVIAGDIGSPLSLFHRCLDHFAGLDCPKLLLAGNHDLYRHGQYNSRVLWEERLPKECADAGFHWLEGTPIVFGRVALCGTMAWYDYSSAPPHLPFGAHEYRLLKSLVNHDADYIDWPWNDLAMARYLAKGLTRSVAALQAQPSTERIVVVTHMPLFSETIPIHPESERWSLISAYLGNYTLGEWVRRQPKVTHVVSGHIHRTGHWIIRGEHGPIDFQVIGSQPGAPALTILDLPA